MTPAERKKKLSEINNLLQTSGYRYNLSKTGVNGKTQMPPPSGTEMSCGSAARIFMQMALDMGIDNLTAVYFKATNGGYFVPDRGGDRALGDMPQVAGATFKGWEFENHYRVKDNTTQVIYDPTFGTESPRNPVGVLCNKEVCVGLEMTSIYGERYKVTRKGAQITTDELSKTPVNPRYNVSDQQFVPKQMDNLRTA